VFDLGNKKINEKTFEITSEQSVYVSCAFVSCA